MTKDTLCCPAEEALSALSGRWKLLIFRLLLSGPKRFNQLQRELKSITHHSLSRQLREMEKRGLIARKDYGENPPRVEYALAAPGRSLEAVVMTLDKWGRQNNKRSSTAQAEEN